jgi:hypothetical protein
METLGISYGGIIALVILIIVFWPILTSPGHSRRVPIRPRHLRAKKEKGVPKYPNPPPPPLGLCKHGFSPEDVMNLKIDPCCKRCGQKLSESKKK